VVKVVDLVSSLTADAIAVALGQPPVSTGTNLFGEAIQAWLDKRSNEAHKILISELKSGNRLDADSDRNSFFGLFNRYLNAVKQGAARRNLRLMAQVLNGSLEPDSPFSADELAENAELVSSLSRNEIKFLAVYWKHYEKGGIKPDGVPSQYVVEGNPMKSLVPLIYSDKHQYFAAAGALTRTGLISAKPVTSGTRFDISPKLKKLVKICNLESALNEPE
jgi:hypothetical protein